MVMNVVLFEAANGLWRARRHADALVLYDHLHKRNPGFEPFRFNRGRCWEALAAAGLAVREDMPASFRYHGASRFQHRLRMAHLVAPLGRVDWVNACFADLDPETLTDRQDSLARCNAWRGLEGGEADWLNEFHRFLGASAGRLTLAPQESGVATPWFLRLRAAALSPVDGPLVTVCVSCFNAEAYVGHAIQSLLNQSYRAVEVIAVDDASTDGTLAILREWERRDARLRVVHHGVNRGTYFNRNEALRMARGMFFTVLDGDDFAMPDRLAFQVAFLQQQPDAAGMLTEWVRMDLDGRFVFKASWGGVYQHEAVATLMVRTQIARERVGYWDAVRFAADTEYLFRLRKVLGEDRVPLVKHCAVISLFHDQSLTNHPVTGINVGDVKGLSPVRVAYRKGWRAWHASGEPLYLEHPLQRRRFDAPSEMQR